MDDGKSAQHAFGLALLAVLGTAHCGPPTCTASSLATNPPTRVYCSEFMGLTPAEEDVYRTGCSMLEHDSAGRLSGVWAYGVCSRDQAIGGCWGKSVTADGVVHVGVTWYYAASGTTAAQIREYCEAINFHFVTP